MCRNRGPLIWLFILVVSMSGASLRAGGVNAGGATEVPHDSELDSTASGAVPAAKENGPPTRHWQRSSTAVALIEGNRVIWRFNYGPALNTPCFHPVGTADGRVLSWDQPPDHPWHHGIWFCWKFINGVNYWEHTGDTGKPEGRTEWSEVGVETRSDHSAVISLALAYHPANDANVVLRERRQIDVSAPDASGGYGMDWTSTFTTDHDEVDLDRVPPRDQAWGGYAGLSVRFAKDFTERQLTSNVGPAEFGEGNRHRSRAAAMDYSGLIDGKTVGLAVLDHPENPRHPTPWYAIRGPVMSYLNAALLAEAPLRLAAGAPMTLRYRLVIHPNRWEADRLQVEYTRFSTHPGSSPNVSHGETTR